MHVAEPLDEHKLIEPLTWPTRRRPRLLRPGERRCDEYERGGGGFRRLISADYYPPRPSVVNQLELTLTDGDKALESHTPLTPAPFPSALPLSPVEALCGRCCTQPRRADASDVKLARLQECHVQPCEHHSERLELAREYTEAA